MMRPGRYYVGDPCYALDRDTRYEEMLGHVFFGRRGVPLDGEFEFADGLRYAVYSTLYGDGCYDGSDGFCYPVDAGCLSVIPVEACDPEELKRATESDNLLGTIVDFDVEFKTESDCRRTGILEGEGGTIVFGHISIFTGDYEDDADYDDEEE